MRLYSRAFAIALCLVPIAVHARNVSPAYHCARMKGAKAEIRLVVRDDEGTPVPEASVRAIFDMPDEEYSLYGKTDTNGTLVVRGKTNGNYIKFLVGKDGCLGLQSRISGSSQALPAVAEGISSPARPKPKRQKQLLTPAFRAAARSV